ncbi:MAG: protein kinase, partial [Anaerolineales bacterium]|nr:protein kinase [Anaerolineales bacterium]
EGGMGVVYKAVDRKLKRTVALKFLSPHYLGTTDEKARFIREAQAAAALDHPNICTVYEINEVKDQLYISMAYIEGVTLSNKIQSGPLKLDEVLDVAIGIAQGLEVAHEKGIVHRDIKSANIMVTEKGQAKITDFGLAKLHGATKVTKTGMTVGTVAYMSPEQARGESVDHRSDVWSLGVVVYEMLTGQLPFKGDYEQVVTYNIVNQDPEPVTALRAGIPMELERIVNQCLEKNPSDRYQHVDELVVDLRNVKISLPDKLEEDPGKSALPNAAAVQSHSPDHGSRDSIPGYQIGRKLSEGGQGVVYQAVQESTRRKVAIKMMREGAFASRSAVARFDREVQVLARLNHPNIVTI